MLNCVCEINGSSRCRSLFFNEHGNRYIYARPSRFIASLMLCIPPFIRLTTLSKLFKFLSYLFVFLYLLFFPTRREVWQ